VREVDSDEKFIAVQGERNVVEGKVSDDKMSVSGK